MKHSIIFAMPNVIPVIMTVLRRSDVRSGRPQTQPMSYSATYETETGGSPIGFSWGHGRPDRASRRGLDARRRMNIIHHYSFFWRIFIVFIIFGCRFINFQMKKFVHR